MKKWEKFEDEVADYIKEKLYSYDVSVEQYGKENSTVPDILITINKNNKKFYVEIKMPLAQTSQFVVEIKNDKFVYSTKNKFKINNYSEEIIKILNDNFNLYKNVSETGMKVSVPEAIALSFIASNMENKNVKFVVTIDDKEDKIIFPVSKFSEIYKVNTILRRKKSGSQSLPKKYYSDVEQLLSSIFKNYNYKLYSSNNKLFLKIPINLDRSNCYIDSKALSNGKRYFLSRKENDLYEIRITSKTNNPNVIFEILLKENVDFKDYGIEKLIKYIEDES